MKRKFWACVAVAVSVILSGVPAKTEEPLKVLIVDGQNNHAVWPQTTQMMKSYLEETKLFTVDIATTKPQGTDPDFHPEFGNYAVVLSNYNGADWPKETQKSLTDYVHAGGGLVIVHAANNAFGQWKEYNEMIGLGGWNGRTAESGPFIYTNEAGDLIRDTSPGNGGSHGSQHEFSVVIRDREHPITVGMPTEWMHTKDELYDSLRGPAINMNVLATAFSDPSTGGTGRHEPMIFTVSYGKGRVFHTPMGHADYSQECVGFITTLQRGTEWAATGKVTVEIPSDFPTADKTSARKYAVQTAN
ncbi:MAG: ThuA domain-containing protein [Planctomyces sp.]|nr:ThuA domain-containing protein [Planctomyces sp.]